MNLKVDSIDLRSRPGARRGHAAERMLCAAMWSYAVINAQYPGIFVCLAALCGATGGTPWSS